MDMDIITRFSNAQAILTAASEVATDNLSFGSDAERNIFFRDPFILKMTVTTVFAGMASGMRVTFRFDTETGLASGSEIVLLDSGILLPANLSANDFYQFRIGPRRLPEGYDFAGVYYVLENEVATGGAVRTWLAEKPEDAPLVDA